MNGCDRVGQIADRLNAMPVSQVRVLLHPFWNKVKGRGLQLQ